MPLTRSVSIKPFEDEGGVSSSPSLAAKRPKREIRRTVDDDVTDMDTVRTKLSRERLRQASEGKLCRRKRGEPTPAFQSSRRSTEAQEPSPLGGGGEASQDLLGEVERAIDVEVETGREVAVGVELEERFHDERVGRVEERARQSMLGPVSLDLFKRLLDRLLRRRVARKRERLYVYAIDRDQSRRPSPVSLTGSNLHLPRSV